MELVPTLNLTLDATAPHPLDPLAACALIVNRVQAERSALHACLALVRAIGPIHERATVDDAITLIQSGAVDLVVARYEASTTPALIERIKRFERRAAPRGSAHRLRELARIARSAVAASKHASSSAAACRTA